MGKIDDLYTHPDWKGIIDLADVTSWDLVDFPDERPEAPPGATAKTLRIFFKSILQVRNVLQGDLAEKVFHDLQERVYRHLRESYPNQADWDGYAPDPEIPDALRPPHFGKVSDDALKTVAKIEIHPNADGKPGGLTREQAKQVRDSFVPAAIERKRELIKAGIMDHAGNVLKHEFNPHYDDVMNRAIDRCESCDKPGADMKHFTRFIWANSVRYQELFENGIIDASRQLLHHGFLPKADLFSQRIVDICQHCDMSGSDPIHGKAE